MRSHQKGILAVLLLLAAAPGAHGEESPGVTRGWIGVGGRNSFGLGGALDPDFGVDAFGGVWLKGEHLLPIVRAGWTRGFGSGTTIDALRFGGGLFAGAAFARERLWVGGGLQLGGVGAWSRGPAGDATSWGAALSASLLVMGRFWQRVLIGAELVPEVVFPTMEFPATGGPLHWGPIRFNAGLRLGVLLGKPVP
jgi:hypothetical protein